MEYYNRLTDLVAQNKALLNKTSVYLTPALTYLNPELKEAVLKFSKPVNTRLYRMYDTGVLNLDTLNLSIVVKINDFKEFNKQAFVLRNLDCYVGDHPFYKAFESNNLHTFVFKLDYPGAIENLLQSKYSKMYHKKDAYEIFKIQKSDTTNIAKTKRQILSICTKDEVYRQKFEQFINTSLSKIQEQNTWISITEDNELDSAIELKKELYYEEE